MSSEFEYSGIVDQEFYASSDISVGKEGSRKIQLLAGTIAGNREKPNEDALAVNILDGTLFVGVFDGTSSQKPIPALGEQSGARFASHFLKDNFYLVPEEHTAKDLLLSLNQHLLAASQAFKGTSIADTHTLPASTGTIIKIDSDNDLIELAHVGDSYCIIFYEDGHSDVVTNDRNQVFDGRMFALIGKIAKERHITPREARQTNEVKEALIKMFIERNNNPNGKGSGLINGDPSVGIYIQEIALPLQGVLAILLGSDGLVPINLSIQSDEGRQKILRVLTTEGFKKLFELKHASEDEDPDFNHIRYKHSDDATGVLLQF